MRNVFLLKSLVNDIHIKQIRVNQGAGVYVFCHFKFLIIEKILQAWHRRLGGCMFSLFSHWFGNEAPSLIFRAGAALALFRLLGTFTNQVGQMGGGQNLSLLYGIGLM